MKNFMNSFESGKYAISIPLLYFAPNCYINIMLRQFTDLNTYLMILYD